MTGRREEFLTTGEAAVLLGSSRQHVVDLCERGLLPCSRAGTHRRVRRVDVEAMLRPDLTRDQLKALWLHRAVAGRLVAAGRAVAPTGGGPVPHPPKLGDEGVDVAATVTAMRDEERW